MRKHQKIEGILQRSFTLDRSAIDADNRTVALSFSSEAPVRRWFGNEILDHDPKSVRLIRMQESGPLLVDHDSRDHIGVVETISVDKDRVGRAGVRFGKSDRANEIFQDVMDGIRISVSVGYRIHKMHLESEEDGKETYRATDWEPYEISIVSIPADLTAGVGRSEELQLIEIREEIPMDPTTETKNPAPVDTAAIQEKVRNDELARMQDIEALGQMHGKPELARTYIKTGQTLNDFRQELLTKPLQSAVVSNPDIGMSDKEVRQFSFLKAIRALANPGDRRCQEDAAFEFEASRAAAEKVQRSPLGLLVPTDVLKRDLTAGTPAAGGYTVANQLLANSFIEKLDNAMLVAQLGATIFRDLVGNIDIPRHSDSGDAYWVAENTDITTASTPTFNQVAMSPKTVGAYSDISRRLLLQSSIDIEAFVRNDLALRLALGIDLKAISGAVSATTPTGILNTTGIGSVSFASSGSPTFGEMVDLETAVDTGNALMGALAYMTTPTMSGALKQKPIDTGSGQFVMAGGEANGYKVAKTKQCTAGKMIFGNWADLIIGMWGGLDLNVDTSAGSKSGMVRVVALQDVDIAVRHAESFAKGQ